MTETNSKGKRQFRACPFREQHFCSFCELYNQKAKACTFIAMNFNMGRIAHALEGKIMDAGPAKG